MNFYIAESFTVALSRLQTPEQKAAKLSAMDLQLNPDHPGLQMHRIDKSKDPNFWSARAGQDLRMIVHKTANSTLLVYVDHHDKAYAWAERRRIEAHPRTGSMQIVELHERVEETPQSSKTQSAPLKHPFARLTPEALLDIGVPPDWVEAIHEATEDNLLDRVSHLPPDVGDALLTFAIEGRLSLRPASAPQSSGLGAFRSIRDAEDLQAILEAPQRSPFWRLPFARYLVSNERVGGTGRPLGWRSAQSYCAYVAGAGRALDLDFGFIAFDDLDLDDVVQRLRDLPPERQRPVSTMRHWVSGMRAYADYLKHEQRSVDIGER